LQQPGTEMYAGIKAYSPLVQLVENLDKNPGSRQVRLGLQPAYDTFLIGNLVESRRDLSQHVLIALAGFWEVHWVFD